MKNIKAFILWCATILLVSCNLNRQPISEIGEGSFYTDAAELNAAVVACYNGLQAPMLQEWMFTETRSDNARFYTTSTSSVANTAILHYDQSSIETTDDNIYQYWLATYNNIARCNSVLAHLDVVTDEALHNQYEGEARFIRAYHYFNLVRLFGPVFIITERISAEQAKQYDRSAVDLVYQQIHDDLEQAATLLPATYAPTDKGRATEWAAKGLLAKVRMTEGLYDEETEALLSDIITHGGFDLQSTYAAVFDIANELNSEILFTIRYTGGGIGLGSPFANYFAPLQSGAYVINGSGMGYNYPTDDLVSAYEAGDERKDVSLALNYLNTDNNTTVDRRWVREYWCEVVLKNDGDVDWPILRYADILLLYAEVLNERQGPDHALPYLNRVRERGGLTPMSIDNCPNKHSMRMAIEKERRVEFAFENHRWFDLIRTDRAVEVMNNHWATETYYEAVSVPTLTKNLLLLPIPQREIDINPNITQNIGY